MGKNERKTSKHWLHKQEDSPLQMISIRRLALDKTALRFLEAIYETFLRFLRLFYGFLASKSPHLSKSMYSGKFEGKIFLQVPEMWVVVCSDWSSEVSDNEVLTWGGWGRIVEKLERLWPPFPEICLKMFFAHHFGELLNTAWWVADTFSLVTSVFHFFHPLFFSESYTQKDWDLSKVV